ncbi:alpha/beta hydrolase family esterase [Streptomyces sp. NPDC048172]|uniref:extracellular catalytic domain type 1 short-chain-length polyhydroxyalkanoate depolymerase n=1 Tax=Streptomyces sp. NPDC048172 TaxID=3365505 RepID=UPI0037127749
MRTRLRRPWLITALLCPLTLLGAAACGGDSGDSGTSERPRHDRADGPRPGNQRASLTWKGKKRTYRVHAPPGYRPSDTLPLVIALHPFPGTGKEMSELSGLDAKADKEKFLVAYPDGRSGGFNAFVCCGSEDDVGFIRQIVKKFTTDWHADKNRVYATGISNGGDLTLKLAVEVPDTFAAIAPVSGGFIGKAPLDPSYAPKSPVSLITFLGGTDRNYSQFRDGMKSWHTRLKCTPESKQRLPKGNSRTTASCRDGSETVVYTLPAMGHAWPGARGADLADPQAGLNATDLVWDFFEKHPRKKS